MQLDDFGQITATVTSASRATLGQLMRKVMKQSAIGEQGIALIAVRVGEMGHLWHPTSGVDSGIDGEIELRDQSTGEVRNFRIGVQSKATEGIWRSETENGFLYRAKPEDVDYWLSSNQPVLLVCSRPTKNEAYWRNVQEWASDPKRRASGLVDFNKQRDRFDSDAAARFFSLEAREAISIEPPGPELRPEKLKTNLLPVVWDTDVVWSVAAPAGLQGGELFQRALSAGAARSDVTVRSGRLWSLTGLDDGYLGAVGAADAVVSEPLDALLGARSRHSEPGRRTRAQVAVVPALAAASLVPPRTPSVLPPLRRGQEAEAAMERRCGTDRGAPESIDEARRPVRLPARPHASASGGWMGCGSSRSRPATSSRSTGARSRASTPTR